MGLLDIHVFEGHFNHTGKRLRRMIFKRKIERHEEGYITLKQDENKIKYCSHCYDKSSELFQLQCNKETGRFYCKNCGMSGVYDETLYDKFRQREQQEESPCAILNEYMSDPYGTNR